MRFRQQRRGPAAVRRYPTRAPRQPSNRR
jgi:hypothetical protein